MPDSGSDLAVLSPAAPPIGRIDRLTLSDLIRDHGPDLLRYVLRLTREDRQLAEDIVREALVRLWQRPEEPRPAHDSLRPWLCTVARNLLLDHWRSRRSRPAQVDGGGLAAPATVRDPIEETGRSRDITQAIRRLTPEHRAVLALVYHRGLAVADAAKQLGIPPGTVKSRTFHALRELRAILDEMGIRLPYPG